MYYFEQRCWNNKNQYFPKIFSVIYISVNNGDYSEISSVFWYKRGFLIKFNYCEILFLVISNCEETFSCFLGLLSGEGRLVFAWALLTGGVLGCDYSNIRYKVDRGRSKTAVCCRRALLKAQCIKQQCEHFVLMLCCLILHGDVSFCTFRRTVKWRMFGRWVG